MAYRPTASTERHRGEVRSRIVRAASRLLRQGGYRAAQVADVAREAGIATGTVYRHFPSKADLFAELFRVLSQRELDALAGALTCEGDARARIAAALTTFASRALRAPRVAYALLAEPVDVGVDAERLAFRRAYAAVLAGAIKAGIRSGELHPQDPALAAAAIVGALGEALLGPLGGDAMLAEPPEPAAIVGEVVAFCLRAITLHGGHS